METLHRPCSGKPSYLAFGAAGKGEARTAPLEGTEADTTVPIVKHPALICSSTLNPTNRRMRTRMYGGVGGEEP